ncbi:tRNA delta(2)-isopentenylpyrophosphate transferase [Desulfonema limicola]|uniref:tRNA dimethylallyltransferase n=1 Tax=Desulfonema limicola TaxID=45656 RepID=A0A975GF90_9BACT|nr:tRNA (adenosine(37)-N6)-dimethylallyltransferase MiaA [Desulfonema limicola]QTA78929.1 tRNA delta(2)-isopentenylpyrophosphate transferase [Desulfonema limicola]
MNAFIKKPDIIVICGPTGVGKTSAAISLAQKFNGEIISSDSMQIYKYMDIGTAKPDSKEQAAVPHHLIDIKEPDEDFDAAMFAQTAYKKIMELYDRGITPFVAGGTGMYIKALIHGIFKVKPVDPGIRSKIKKDAELLGSRVLYERLYQCDPETAEKIHPNDTYRIIRALEIYESTGSRISKFHKQHGFSDEQFNVLKIGLGMEREKLYERINQRVDIMMEQGFEHEVRDLLAKGYSPALKSMQSIGYRHIADFIYDKIDKQEALVTMKRDTRRYAKRQFTWFKADPRVIWTKPENLEDIELLIKKFLQGESIYINK